MKVLHVCTTDSGGAGIACLRLHEALLNNGVDSRVLVLIKSKENSKVFSMYEHKLEFLFKKILNKIHILQLLNKPKGPESFWTPFSSHKIESHELIEWADIINLHWVAGFLDYNSFFNAVNKPIVWTLHDMLPFSGGYHYLEGFPLRYYKNLINKYEKVKKNSIANKNIRIVSLNKWMQVLSSNSFVFEGLINEIIPNSVPLDKFYSKSRNGLRSKYGLKLTDKVLLFVSDNVLNKRKGISLLIKALEIINNKDLKLLIVGSNEPLEGFKEIKNEQIYLGSIDSFDEMSNIYSVSDLFVVPSIEDNLPNTVLESIATSIPVIAFQIGGIPDIITDGINGVLSKSITPEGLSKAILKGLGTQFVKENIRKDCSLRYNNKLQADRYIDLYKRMINI